MVEASSQLTDEAPSREAFQIEPKSYRLAVLAILLIAAGLRLWAIDFGLPHPHTRPDEYEVVELTAIPLDGQLDIGWPIYPHTYIYLLSAWGALGVEIGQLFGWVDDGSYRDLLNQDRASLYLILRLLSALIGTLAVWASIRLTAAVFPRAAALAVGLLVATNFLHSRDSHAIKPDTLLSLAILVTLMLVVPLARKATPRRGLMAGLAAGAAIAAKYPGVMVTPAVYFAALMGSGPISLRRLFPLPGVLAAIGAAGFFLATNPYVFLSPSSVATWESLARANLPMLFDESKEEPAANVHTIGPSEAQLEKLLRLGNLPRYGDKPWWDGFVYHTRFSLLQGSGWVATGLAPFALAWALLAGKRKRRVLTIPAGIFILAYFGVFSLSPAQMARYMTPLVPVLLMLEIGMLFEALEALAQKNPSVAGRGPVLLACLTFLVGAEPAYKTIQHNRIAAREDTRNLTTQWLAENTPKGARIKVLGTLFMPYGRPELPPGRWVSRAEPTVAGLVQDRVDYVMTHEHFLFSSTIDPAEFEAIESRLELLVEFDPYEGAAGNPEEAVYEIADAYYIPVAGFANQTRPGPLVRIYSFSRAP
jgi:hypothetical protein